MEALSRILKRVRGENFITGFSVDGRSNGQLIISHLFFVNDTLIICGAELEQIWYLKANYVWFQIIYGLKINLRKSELVLVGDVLNVDALASVLRSKVS